MATFNNKRPFDDISAQESRLLLDVISSIKDPLLRIYDIGVEAGCSHYKHLPRLAEYVVLATPGEVMLFPFNEEKTERTKRNFWECNLTEAQKTEVSKLWVALVEVLKTFKDEDASPHEQFVFHFLLRLVKNFAGGNNVETFHIEKRALFDSYNIFIVESKKIELPTDEEEKDALLGKVNIPVVVA